LFIVGIFGLYGFYLFWLGSSKLVGIPENQRIGFVLLSVLILIVIYAILSFIIFSYLLVGIIGTAAVLS
jgi:dolichyl-phosphate-mannose--protein O-mannosyl transferase